MMKQGFQLHTTQKLKMSQKQMQSLNILTMDQTQLLEFMQNEYLENPMLEYTGGQDGVYGADDISSRYEHAITYEKTYEELIEEDDKRRRDLPDTEPELVKKTLLYQLPFQDFTEKQWELFNYMIDCLDETGFFTMSLEETAFKAHVTLQEAERALDILKGLEPHGIFARDLRECLLIQLDFKGMKGTNTWKIVEEYLEDVAKGRIGTISRGLSLSTAQVRLCIQQIAHLNPRPMNFVAAGDKNKYIIPDILLKKEQGVWRAELNDGWIENYQINDYYIRIMKESQDEELCLYFQKKLDRVRLIQEGIRQRRQTLIDITTAIVAHQTAFFDGNGLLAPMTMAELAGELNIHASTVSRAAKGKYIQCRQGTLLLRDLFSAAVSSGDDEAAVNADNIKDMISRLIKEEDRKKPLSDQKITNALKEKGIHVSRRAVAKYREALGIKGSFERKL